MFQIKSIDELHQLMHQISWCIRLVDALDQLMHHISWFIRLVEASDQLMHQIIWSIRLDNQFLNQNILTEFWQFCCKRTFLWRLCFIPSLVSRSEEDIEARCAPSFTVLRTSLLYIYRPRLSNQEQRRSIDHCSKGRSGWRRPTVLWTSQPLAILLPIHLETFSSDRNKFPKVNYF